MKIERLFEIFECMYGDRPYKDDEGRLVYVPNPVVRLVNACELFETQLYRDPLSISSYRYDLFLELTRKFILSIPLNSFNSYAESLDYSSKETLLRNFDNIISRCPSSVLAEYAYVLANV